MSGSILVGNEVLPQWEQGFDKVLTQNRDIQALEQIYHPPQEVPATEFWYRVQLYCLKNDNQF